VGRVFLRVLFGVFGVSCQREDRDVGPRPLLEDTALGAVSRL
jgi:hypothetical protein